MAEKQRPGPKPKHGERTVSMTTRLPLSVKAALEEQARREGRPTSEIVVEKLSAKGSDE